MKIGIVGGTKLAGLVARQLAKTHSVQVHGGLQDSYAPPAGTTAVASLRELAGSVDLVIIAAANDAEVSDVLFGEEGLSGGLSSGKTVIDQTPGDPDAARKFATELQQLGVSWIDAPLHCELLDALPDVSAITCGGSAQAISDMRPLLESISPKVVQFGEAGAGRAARLVVGAIAVCNRLVTYEAAAMGHANGLSVADMATVLNRCSGSSSATARVLPSLDSGDRMADASLAQVVEELRLATVLGTRVGAPMMVANLAHGLLMPAASHLDEAATLDDTVDRFMPGLRR
jgi:3-hydroxyisobutyrate dehydrogenase